MTKTVTLKLALAGLLMLGTAIQAADRVCHGHIESKEHPEYSGDYTVSLGEVGKVTFAGKTRVLPKCEWSPLGGGCQEGTYPGYGLFTGDIGGIHLGVFLTKDDYVFLGELGNCQW